MPIGVEGIDQTLRALRKISPTLYKEMNAKIRPALKAITTDAKTHVPSSMQGLSHFEDNGKVSVSRTSRERAFPHFKPSEVKSGLTYRTSPKKPNRSGWSAVYSVINKSAASMITEWAGRVNPRGSANSKSNNPKAGEWFIDHLNSGVGEIEKVRADASTRRSGRLLYPAVKRNEGHAKAAILKAVESTISLFKAEM
jgi:hypothetical protein